MASSGSTPITFSWWMGAPCSTAWPAAWRACAVAAGRFPASPLGQVSRRWAPPQNSCPAPARAPSKGHQLHPPGAPSAQASTGRACPHRSTKTEGEELGITEAQLSLRPLHETGKVCKSVLVMGKERGYQCPCLSRACPLPPCLAAGPTHACPRRTPRLRILPWGPRLRDLRRGRAGRRRGGPCGARHARPRPPPGELPLPPPRPAQRTCWPSTA